MPKQSHSSISLHSSTQSLDTTNSKLLSQSTDSLPQHVPLAQPGTAAKSLSQTVAQGGELRFVLISASARALREAAKKEVAKIKVPVKSTSKSQSTVDISSQPKYVEVPHNQTTRSLPQEVTGSAQSSVHGSVSGSLEKFKVATIDDHLEHSQPIEQADLIPLATIQQKRNSTTGSILKLSNSSVNSSHGINKFNCSTNYVMEISRSMNLFNDARNKRNETLMNDMLAEIRGARHIETDQAISPQSDTQRKGKRASQSLWFKFSSDAILAHGNDAIPSPASPDALPISSEVLQIPIIGEILNDQPQQSQELTIPEFKATLTNTSLRVKPKFSPVAMTVRTTSKSLSATHGSPMASSTGSISSLRKKRTPMTRKRSKESSTEFFQATFETRLDTVLPEDSDKTGLKVEVVFKEKDGVDADVNGEDEMKIISLNVSQELGKNAFDIDQIIIVQPLTCKRESMSQRRVSFKAHDLGLQVIPYDKKMSLGLSNSFHLGGDETKPFTVVWNVQEALEKSIDDSIATFVAKLVQDAIEDITLDRDATIIKQPSKFHKMKSGAAGSAFGSGDIASTSMDSILSKSSEAILRDSSFLMTAMIELESRINSTARTGSPLKHTNVMKGESDNEISGNAGGTIQVDLNEREHMMIETDVSGSMNLLLGKDITSVKSTQGSDQKESAAGDARSVEKGGGKEKAKHGFKGVLAKMKIPFIKLKGLFKKSGKV